MRSFFLINFLVHISLIAIACEDDSTSDDLLYPETIMGHWDIEGGGTLFFEEENFSASVGCNTLFGPLTIDGNTLVFSVILSTLIGCPDSEARLEQELSTQLDSATLTYRIKNNHAYLENIQGQKVLNLIRPINVKLVNAWKLNSLRTEMAVSSSILDDDSGITFLSDGKVRCLSICLSVIINPSKTETLGIVCIESLMAGTPVAGYADCPGTMDIFKLANGPLHRFLLS